MKYLWIRTGLINRAIQRTLVRFRDISFQVVFRTQLISPPIFRRWKSPHPRQLLEPTSAYWENVPGESIENVVDKGGGSLIWFGQKV